MTITSEKASVSGGKSLLGPGVTQQVVALIKNLKRKSIGICKMTNFQEAEINIKDKYVDKKARD